MSLLAPEEEMQRVFAETYPTETRMPFQGAWPIDFWALEATASAHPELWWMEKAVCACGREAAMSYEGIYYCREHFPAAQDRSEKPD